MDFVRRKFSTNEPLPVEHLFPHFWPVFCAHTANRPKSEEKVFNWQRFICTEVTSYKIHTLHIWPSPYILQFAKTYPTFIAILFYTLSVWLKPCLKDLLWKNNYIFRHWSQIMIFILVGGPPKLITVKQVQRNFWQPQRPKVYGNK